MTEVYTLQVSTQQHVGSVFISSIFFGLYLASLFACLRWLIWADEGWKLRENIHWPTFSVALFIFACSTASIGIILHGLLLEVTSPIVHPKPIPVTGKPGYTWGTVVQCTLANFVTLAADAILIWRCWLIYGRSLRVAIFPLVIWVGGFICTILQIYWQIIEAQGLDTAWQPHGSFIGPGTVLAPFWGSTILLNLFATVVITIRLMKVVKEVEGLTSAPSQLRFVSRVIAESGVLYLGITLIHFIVWFTPSVVAISVVSNFNIPVTGITYNLIVIRTSQERARDAQAFRSGRPPIMSFKFGDIETPTSQSKFGLETTETEDTDRTRGGTNVTMQRSA